MRLLKLMISASYLPLYHGPNVLIAPALNGVTLAPWQIYRRLASVLSGLAFTMARLNGLGV